MFSHCFLTVRFLLVREDLLWPQCNALWFSMLRSFRSHSHLAQQEIVRTLTINIERQTNPKWEYKCLSLVVSLFCTRHLQLRTNVAIVQIFPDPYTLALDHCHRLSMSYRDSTKCTPRQCKCNTFQLGIWQKKKESSYTIVDTIVDKPLKIYLHKNTTLSWTHWKWKICSSQTQSTEGKLETLI